MSKKIVKEDKYLNYIEKQDLKYLEDKIFKKASKDLKIKYYILLKEANFIIEDFSKLILKKVKSDYDFQNHSQTVYNKFLFSLERDFLSRLTLLNKNGLRIKERDNIKTKELIETKSILYNKIDETDLNNIKLNNSSYDPEFYARTKNILNKNNLNNYNPKLNKSSSFVDKSINQECVKLKGNDDIDFQTALRDLLAEQNKIFSSKSKYYSNTNDFLKTNFSFKKHEFKQGNFFYIRT